MKKRIYILGVFAALCFLFTWYNVWTLHEDYCKQVLVWNEEAKDTFEEALWMEVNKRAEIPIYHASETIGGEVVLSEEIPDSVYVTTLSGRKGYHLERCKYENSLVKDREQRIRIGVLLLEYPFLLEDVYNYWDSLFSVKQISVESQIRYIYADLDLKSDTMYSSNIPIESHMDSLTVKYLGFRCEHELTAYVSYPNWLFSLAYSDWFVLLFPWFLLIWLVAGWSKLETWMKRKFTHEKVIEREIHVADISMDKTGILRLPDGTLFDSFSGSLSKDGLQRRLQPQSVSLLKLLLNKNNHKATSEEICMKLWGDTGHSDRLYSAVRRLRNDLKAVKSELLVDCSYGMYELKSPISSNISDQN